MRRMKKIVTVLMALSLTVTGMLGSGMTAKADSCGGLAEEDVYTPGEDEVIKDPFWQRVQMHVIRLHSVHMYKMKMERFFLE